MEVLNVCIAVLIIVASCPHYSRGSTTETKVLNVGDDLTLACVTDWDPNVYMNWYEETGPSTTKLIAKAGNNPPTCEIDKNSRNDSRISCSFYNGSVSVSSSERKINTLHISNMTEQDSAAYSCVSFGLRTTNVHNYNIIVSKYNFSIDTNVTCDLVHEDSGWLNASISFNGETVTAQLKGNLFSFSTSNSNDAKTHHSIMVSSPDGDLMNITCTLFLPSKPSSTARMTTSFTKPNSSLTKTIVTGLNKESTTMRSKSVSQRSSRSSSVRLFSEPTISSTPFPSGITEEVETQTNPTTVINKQEPTDSSKASQFPMTVDMSTASSTSFVSSASQPTSTTEKSLSSTKAQPTSVPQTFSSTVTKSVHSSAVPMSTETPFFSSSMTKLDMTPSELSTSKTGDTSPASMFISTIGINDHGGSNYHMTIILISTSISAGMIILVLIILLMTRRQNCKSSNVRGRNKIRRDQTKSPGAKLKTLSTTIPDFTFQNSGMTICHLKREESTNDHYYSPILDLNIQQNILTTDNLIGSNKGSSDLTERSDCKVDLSDKRFAETQIHTSETIPMKDLKNSNGPDTSDAAHLYFVLENEDKTNCFPNQDTYTPSSGGCKVSGESMVDNILYQSSDPFHPKTTTGPCEQKADDTRLYFVLEDHDSREPCSSDNP